LDDDQLPTIQEETAEEVSDELKFTTGEVSNDTTSLLTPPRERKHPYPEIKREKKHNTTLSDDTGELLLPENITTLGKLLAAFNDASTLPNDDDVIITGVKSAGSLTSTPRRNKRKRGESVHSLDQILLE
jgi:hypothetical protein